MTPAVVTITHRRTAHLRLQHSGLARSTRTVVRYVVVAIDDDLAGWEPDTWPVPTVVRESTTPRGLPLARARNLGAHEAFRRGADVVVFLDVDCVPSPSMVQAYLDALAEHPGALACGPVAYLPPAPPGGYDLDTLETLADPHPARPAPAPGSVLLDPDGHDLFWSLSFALRRETWETIGGFDEAYAGYGGEDTDFGRRARAAGVPLAWVGGARSFHQHHPVSDPPVEHLDDVVRNATLFHDRWGEWPMVGWLDAFERDGLVNRTKSGYVVSADRGSQRRPCRAPRDGRPRG